MKIINLIIEKIKEIPVKNPGSDDYDWGCRDMRERIINLLKNYEYKKD